MKSRNWTPLVIFLFFAALYQCTLARSFSYDGTSYALDIEFGTWRQLFHPNHLLFSALYNRLLHLAQWLGYHGRAIFFMGSANAIVGAAAVALLAEELSLGTTYFIGSLAAILFGVSQAFWPEAIDPGCYALAGLAAVLLLRLLLEREGSPPFRAGLLHGFLVLFHQMLILVAPAFLIAWDVERRGKKYFFPYCAGLFVGAVLPYGIAAHAIQGGTWAQELSWVLTPAGTPPSGKLLSGFWWHWNFFPNLYASWDGLVEGVTVLRPWGGLFMAISLAFLVAWSVQEFRQKSRRSPDIAAAWIWIFSLGLFQFFFFHATRYTILLLPPVLYLVAAMAAQFVTGLWRGALALAVLIVAITNYALAIAPRKAWLDDLGRIEWIAQQLKPKDFLLFQGRGERAIRNVDKAYFAPQIPARSLFGYLLDQYGQPKTHMEGLGAMFKEAWKHGGHVWVEKGLLDPRRQQAIESEARIVNGSLRKWFKGYRAGRKRIGPEGYVLVELRPAFHTE